jgi:hypothetical protein
MLYFNIYILNIILYIKNKTIISAIFNNFQFEFKSCLINLNLKMNLKKRIKKHHWIFMFWM